MLKRSALGTESCASGMIPLSPTSFPSPTLGISWGHAPPSISHVSLSSETKITSWKWRLKLGCTRYQRSSNGTSGISEKREPTCPWRGQEGLVELAFAVGLKG